MEFCGETFQGGCTDGAPVRARPAPSSAEGRVSLLSLELAYCIRQRGVGVEQRLEQ
jgi:hypothetical protein